eukprot:TRINITY_DN16595_c0_g3_i1.p1 TRINITY_DN16595_c0_g3~~TRINITY_DN16595_c0_g3_i1.p1  ORF type:complete len:673 (+),score=151.13 TRINITY_DN16595_c0_g3_i1:1-2019(+)
MACTNAGHLAADNFLVSNYSFENSLHFIHFRQFQWTAPSPFIINFRSQRILNISTSQKIDMLICETSFFEFPISGYLLGNDKVFIRLLNSSNSGDYLPNWIIRVSWNSSLDAFKSTNFYPSSMPISSVIRGPSLYIAVQTPSYSKTACPPDSPRVFLSVLVQPVRVLNFNFSNQIEKIAMKFDNDTSGKRPFIVPLDKLAASNRALFVRSVVNTSASQQECDTSVSVSAPVSLFYDFAAGDWSSPYSHDSGIVLPVSISGSSVSARSHADWGQTLSSAVSDKSIGLLVTGVVSADLNESNPFCSWSLEVTSIPSYSDVVSVTSSFASSLNLFDFFRQKNTITVKFLQSFDRFLDFVANSTYITNAYSNATALSIIQSLVDDYISHRASSLDLSSVVFGPEYQSLVVTIPPLFDFPRYMDSYKNLSSKTVSVGITWPWEYTEKSYFYPNHSVALTISSVLSTQKATSLSSLFSSTNPSASICGEANMIVVSMLFNTSSVSELYWSLYQKNNKSDTFQAGDFNGFTFCVIQDTTYVLTTFNACNVDSGSGNMSFSLGFRKANKGSLYSYNGSHSYSKSYMFTVGDGLNVSITAADGSSEGGALVSVWIPPALSASPLTGGVLVAVVIGPIVAIALIAGLIWWKIRARAKSRGAHVNSSITTATEIAVVPQNSAE